ncbi:MAG: DUF2961 domain-containing protein [bacterium]
MRARHRAEPLLGTSALAVLLGPALAFAQAAGGYGDYVAWEDWARVVPGERAVLASSWDRTGGDVDANQYESPTGLIQGDRNVTAATLRGPGIIYRFWMPHYTATRPFAIRMYFDGESSPRIDSDTGQILGGTFGYFGSPFVTTFAGGQVSYEPIAFEDSVRIETENRAGLWHWYQYSARTFAPGTGVTSYTGALAPDAGSARAAAAAMLQNVGQHPAGESATSVRDVARSVVVPPNGSLTVVDLAGSGLIRRLNVRMDGAADAALDSLRLRVFYDASTTSAIDAPVGWLFGAGHGRVPYKSLPLGTDSPDGFYSYWPMPFRDGARLELANVSSSSIGVDSVVVEHEARPISSDLGYLHVAAKRQLRPAGQLWNLMADARGTGHYVGNLLYVQQPAPDNSFLEGDDLVVVDGADSLHGTGMEDAYNGGLYYNWADLTMPEPEGPHPSSAIRPLSGILRVEKSTSPRFACADQYRWRIGDRVPFSRSCEVSVETQYSWSGSQWISVVFWYQLPVVPTGAPPAADVPARRLGVELHPSEPNPVHDTTVMRFSLPKEAAVALDLLDVRGRKVRSILEGRQAAGTHALRWSRGVLPNGVYFLRLRAAGAVETRKLVLVR